MNKKVKKIIKFLIIFLLISSIISIINFVFFPNKVEKVSYLKFEEMIKEKQVQKVIIDFKSATFNFYDIKGNKYITDNPRTNNFKKFLLTNNIEIREINSSNTLFVNLISNMISLIIWVLVIGFLFKGTLKSMTPVIEDKSNKYIKTSAVKFSDIAGNTEPKQDMINMINFLKHPDDYKKMGAKLPKGYIFYGPPGTGKTLMAKAIAGEANVPFFSISGSDFVELYVGVGAKRVRELFKEAKKHAPCVLFIDEIDAIGGKRGSVNNNSEREQTINALLSELDGFDGSEDILVIAATNRLDMLDEALIRPGRFDRHIAISLPDYKDRLEILQLYANNKKISNDVDLDVWAKLTIGFSGAGLFTLLNESAIIAVDNKHEQITNEDIDDAYYKLLLKGNKKSNSEDRKNDEIKIIAWHEAGHAVAAKLLTNRSVPKVTIVPSTSGAGGVTFITPEKRGLFSKQELINDVKINYAGRVGEYLLLNDENKITTGASNDIQQATKKIKSIIEEYGMTEFGLLNLNELEYIDKNSIAKKASEMSTKIYKETLNLLTENKEIVEKVANILIEKETIDEKELDNLIKS